jgi:hypothetical protein
MTTQIYNKENELIRTSRNLRGLLDHARRELPVTVDLRETERGYFDLRVGFLNGDYAWSRWASWRVAADWLRARRSWGLPSIGYYNEHEEFAARYLEGR